ncbi:hypothetical protein [Marinobacter adhaerens]|jgi:hypothetical protein|uniref:hypothetical protein n=1 Tax=Marinobacter adhaerens TaxID=1033846 RepID=UPI003BAB755E
MPIVKYCIVSIACLLVSMNVNATQSSDLPYPVEVFQTYCVSSDGDHRQIVNMAKAMEFDEITGEALNATINPDTEGKAYVVERKPAERQMITLGTTTINTCSVYTQGYATMENLSYIRENFGLRTIDKVRVGMETREVLVPNSAPNSRPAMFSEGVYTFSYPDDEAGSILGYIPPAVSMEAMTR